MGTPSASPSQSVSNSPSASVSSSPSRTPSASASVTPSASISASPSRTPSASLSASPSASPSVGYEDYEISVEEGEPVELFDFAQDTTHWRYTSAAYDITYGGNTYTQIPGLKAGGIETARNVLRATLEIEAPWSCLLAQEFLDEPPDGRISLTYYQGHNDRFTIRWRGWLRNVNFRTPRKCLLPCTPSAADLGYGGLCLRPGKLCQAPLYSALCGVDEDDYTVAGVIESVSGLEVTSATFSVEASQYYRGGNFTARGVTRMIVDHVGDTIELAHGISGLAANQTFTASAGCDHTHTVCAATFDNLLNQKGYRFMSTRNPFIEGVL